MERWLITFPSVYYAFRAEKILRQNSVAVKLVPVPRSLSGSCEGLAAEIDGDRILYAVDLLNANKVNMIAEGILVTD